MRNTRPVHIGEQGPKHLVAKFRHHLEERTIENGFFGLGPDLADRGVREFDDVIRPFQDGDQRRRLHEQRVQQPLLEFRLFARQLFALPQHRVRFRGATFVLDVRVRAEPVGDLASRVSNRVHARQEAAKLPVGAPQRKHHLEGRSRVDRRPATVP